MNDTGTTTAQIEGLIARLRRGDPAARDELLSCASARLERLARKMLGDFPVVRRHEGTDDVFNAAAWRLYRALGQAMPESALHFFRLGAVQIRRQLIDLARRYKDQPPLAPFPAAAGGSDSAGSAVPEPPDDTDDPRVLEWWRRFHEAAESLPDGPREVFDLIWYHGLKQVEAAELLRVHVNTVRNRYMEARLLLCEELGDEMPGW